MKSLRAGVSICSINPDKGVALGGYPHAVRKNTGVHDSIYAAVLYLDSENPVIIASLDLLGFSKVYADRVRCRIAGITGISRSNIMIMCTHTHSSPYGMTLLDVNEAKDAVDEDYVEMVSNKLTQAILDAVENTFAASIGFGKGICGREKGVGGNRKNPHGISDPEVCVLGIKDENGELRACMANYALHPTFLHAENLLVSADYPGYIRKHLNKAQPEAVFLFAQGASGDQSSRYFRNEQSFDEARRVGYMLGEEILRVLGSINYEKSADISIKNKVLDSCLRGFPSIKEAEENLEKVLNKYKKMKLGNGGYAVLRNMECDVFGAERTLEYVKLIMENKKLPRIQEEHPLEISLIQINNSLMVMLQGEVFVRFGQDIKKGSPFENTFVVEMANGGSAGYIYTKEALEEFGGYEIQSSLYSWEMGESIVREVLKLMKF